jgi:hypothetical protein
MIRREASTCRPPHGSRVEPYPPPQGRTTEHPGQPANGRSSPRGAVGAERSQTAPTRDISRSTTTLADDHRCNEKGPPTSTNAGTESLDVGVGLTCQHANRPVLGDGPELSASRIASRFRIQECLSQMSSKNSAYLVCVAAEPSLSTASSLPRVLFDQFSEPVQIRVMRLPPLTKLAVMNLRWLV